MGEINMLAIFLAALAFFVIGMVWYGLLFGKIWQREAGITDGTIARGHNMALIFVLAFLFELLIALMLGHQYARTNPSPRGLMMIATGFGATIMAPAIGINYLFQRKSWKLFAIDAGHLIVGMTAMGLVFLAFR
ncbi:DUF1761 domain-containing protein [Altericroceibacterium spongiae]|uniref:DUF1761 domain-containing protein n=1 Tax=Altericroceibacterium spongiae TaxID=2320269 RepID=A0A420EKY2_9SPHN|nr:DUF1761 domain-containing protein [Altericroceibacterium spongiae]RKF21266.1 DUF1761 domain-containing protein [Altericroceibacterium spongiae]